MNTPEGYKKAALSLMLTLKDLEPRLKNLFDLNGITMLGDYKGGKIKTRWRHICGHEWDGRPTNVFHRKRCPQCSLKSRTDKRRLPSQRLEEYLNDLKECGISLLGKYINSGTKTLFRHECGHKWEAVPDNVLRQVSGCPKCGLQKIADRFRLTPEKLQMKLDVIAKDGVTMVGKYINSQTKMRFRHVCGHEWITVPLSVLWRRSRCPKCAKYGFQIDKPATLYYIKVRNGFTKSLYKIGITNRTIQDRFEREFEKITIIETWHFQNGFEAWEMEQDILRDYGIYRYNGPAVLKAGNDEVFNMDVLGLDNEKTNQIDLPF